MITCKNIKANLTSLMGGINTIKTEFSITTKTTVEVLWSKHQELMTNIETLRSLLTISESRAETLMGTDLFLGSRVVQETWGVELAEEDIPVIPFSLKELETARQDDQVFLLVINEDAKGRPLTPEHIKAMIEEKWAESEDKNKLLHNTTWYKDEDFFTTQAPELPGGMKAHWMLVKKDLLDGSKSKSALELTQMLVDHLTTTILKDIPPTDPRYKEYQEALQEFEASKDHLKTILDIPLDDWNKLSKEEKIRRTTQLTILKINQLLRSDFPTHLYFLATYLNHTNIYLLPSGTYHQTNSIVIKSAGDLGRLVDVGAFGSTGALVAAMPPGIRSDDIGVSFSRLR